MVDISFVCVLIAAVLPYVFVSYAKFSAKGYDNSNPRAFLEKLEGKAKRAHYAQLNSFEAFPAFAVAVIIAYLARVPAAQVTALSVLFIIFRTLHGIYYILDHPSLRSLVWFGGLFSMLALFILALTQTGR